MFPAKLGYLPTLCVYIAATADIMHGWRINAAHIPEGEYVGRLSQRVSPSTPEKIKKEYIPHR